MEIVGILLATITFFSFGMVIYHSIKNNTSRKRNIPIVSTFTVNNPVPIQRPPDETIFLRKKDLWVNQKTDFIIGRKTVIDLLESSDTFSIGYSDLLNCMEWQYKRLKILVRDGFKCQDCNQSNEHLHVHHLYYLKNHLPWDIEDLSLVSLCARCHKQRHEREKITVYEKVYSRLIPTSNYNLYCSRCNGAGYFPQFNHVQDGICFRCKGDCIERTLFSEPLNRIKNGRFYDTDVILEDIIKFFDGITVQEYRSKIAHIHNEDTSTELSRHPYPSNNNYAQVEDTSDDLPF